MLKNGGISWVWGGLAAGEEAVDEGGGVLTEEGEVLVGVFEDVEIVLVYLLQLFLQGFYLCFLLFVANGRCKRLFVLLLGILLILQLVAGTIFLGIRIDIPDLHIDGLALTL